MKKLLILAVAILINCTMVSCTTDEIADKGTSSTVTGGGDGTLPIPPPPAPKP